MTLDTSIPDAPAWFPPALDAERRKAAARAAAAELPAALADLATMDGTSIDVLPDGRTEEQVRAHVAELKAATVGD